MVPGQSWGRLIWEAWASPAAIPRVQRLKNRAQLKWGRLHSVLMHGISLARGIDTIKFTPNLDLVLRPCKGLCSANSRIIARLGTCIDNRGSAFLDDSNFVIFQGYLPV